MPALNFTKRIDIPRRAVDLLVEHAGTERRELTVKLDFGEVDVPADALVLVEAQYRGLHKRFEYGVAGDPKAPRDRGIGDFPTDAPIVNITVVDPMDRRILAVRRNLRPSNVGELLPVVTTDLGQALWHLRINPTSGPTLEVTDRIPGIETTKTLHAFVLPEAFRSVLRSILLDPDYDGDDDESWQRAWITFAAEHAGDGPPEPGGVDRAEWLKVEEETVQDWIDGSIQVFAAKHRLLDDYRDDTGGGNA